MFTAKSVGKARCQWCLKEVECLEVKFADGLTGVFCWADVKKAEKSRDSTKPSETSEFTSSK
jgi:hypothetical protein